MMAKRNAESEYKPITSQEQYEKYLYIRTNFIDFRSEYGRRAYNQLTVHIVNWRLKMDKITEPSNDTNNVKK
jgi:hypothetical protein